MPIPSIYHDRQRRRDPPARHQGHGEEDPAEAPAPALGIVDLLGRTGETQPDRLWRATGGLRPPPPPLPARADGNKRGSAGGGEVGPTNELPIEQRLPPPAGHHA